MLKFTPAILTALRRVSIGTPHRGLNEFFDDPKNWGVPRIQCGRPWRKDELRLKSNQDLHKLWYILLKERNMLMTMEEEYNRCFERLPQAERLEKVEESMENLMLVVEERNRAEAELEQGEWIGPSEVPGVDILGRPVTILTSEHTQPRVADKSAQADEMMWSGKTVELLRLEREKHRRLDRKSRVERRREDRKTRWNQVEYVDA